MPNQLLASKPRTKSPTVGMSGNESGRVAVVTANARSLPGQKQFILLGIFECGVQSNQSERHLR